jgi:hypothetical protein
MLVALHDEEAQLCSEILVTLTADAPLQVMRVAHIRAACERMLVTRPLLVVFASSLSEEEQRMLSERAEDISAQVVRVTEPVSAEKMKLALSLAITATNAE